MKNISLSLIGLVLFAAAPVYAGEGACKADREKLCKDVQPGEGRIAKCMMEHKAELSAECKAQHEKVKTALKEAKQACQDDISTLCSDVDPGKGRIVRCLHENKDKLSEGCKTEMAQMKDMRKGKGKHH